MIMRDNAFDLVWLNREGEGGGESIKAAAVHKPRGWDTSKHSLLKAIIHGSQWISAALRTSKGFKKLPQRRRGQGAGTRGRRGG